MSKPQVVDLTELFELQEAFDATVMSKHPNVENILEKKYAALLVEIGEMMNEWRGFKFWSKDQEPRTTCVRCFTREIHTCSNPLLEEWADCLHFAISLAIDHNVDVYNVFKIPVYGDHWSDLDLFLELFRDTSGSYADYNDEGIDRIEDVLGLLFVIGDRLGFTFEQMVKAYKAKNAENYNRQERGY